MITEENILNLGYKHVASCANGGTKLYSKKNVELIFNGDNSIYQRNNDSRLTLIIIKRHKNRVQKELYSGHPSSIEELKTIIEQFE